MRYSPSPLGLWSCSWSIDRRPGDLLEDLLLSDLLLLCLSSSSSLEKVRRRLILSGVSLESLRSLFSSFSFSSLGLLLCCCCMSNLVCSIPPLKASRLATAGAGSSLGPPADSGTGGATATGTCGAAAAATGGRGGRGSRDVGGPPADDAFLAAATTAAAAAAAAARAGDGPWSPSSCQRLLRRLSPLLPSLADWSGSSLPPKGFFSPSPNPPSPKPGGGAPNGPGGGTPKSGLLLPPPLPNPPSGGGGPLFPKPPPPLPNPPSWPNPGGLGPANPGPPGLGPGGAPNLPPPLPPPPAARSPRPPSPPPAPGPCGAGIGSWNTGSSQPLFLASTMATVRTACSLLIRGKSPRISLGALSRCLMRMALVSSVRCPWLNLQDSSESRQRFPVWKYLQGKPLCRYRHFSFLAHRSNR